MVRLTKIKLPFGLNENNIIVHIANLEDDEKCDYICPDCKSPLIAVKGKIKQHHFRHKDINECQGGLESAIHLAAKQMIVAKKQIMLPRYVCTASIKDSKGHNQSESMVYLAKPKIAYFDSVQVEKSLKGMKVDILAENDARYLIIEIFYRHKVDDQKIEKIKNANMSAIEINLSELKPEHVGNSEAFWSCMNDPRNIQWLHNAKAHEIVYPVLVSRLAIKIKRIEREYDALQQQVKEELTRDLKIIRVLRDKRYREMSIKELRKHHVWRIHGEGSNLSLDSLPNFLNLYVSDGDWIFSCDRRIWQIIIYHSFICNNRRDPHFFVREVVTHIQNYCNVPRSLVRVQESARYYPELAASNALENMPSPQETVRAYCNYLCDLGMLEYAGDMLHLDGNFDFKIISKTPGAT